MKFFCNRLQYFSNINLPASSLSMKCATALLMCRRKAGGCLHLFPSLWYESFWISFHLSMYHVVEPLLYLGDSLYQLVVIVCWIFPKLLPHDPRMLAHLSLPNHLSRCSLSTFDLHSPQHLISTRLLPCEDLLRHSMASSFAGSPWCLWLWPETSLLLLLLFFGALRLLYVKCLRLALLLTSLFHLCLAIFSQHSATLVVAQIKHGVSHRDVVSLEIGIQVLIQYRALLTEYRDLWIGFCDRV